MKYQGFMLIEIMLASVIATMIGGILFIALNQINKYVVITENYADIYTKAAIAHKQFEKDLSGIFIPLLAQKTDNAKPTDSQVKKDDMPKQVTKVFYAKNGKDKNLSVLSFITNNPMQVYWSDRAGKAKPRIARVVYRLMPDKKNKKAYKLMRQESENLYYDDYKPGGTKDIREYEVIDDIKSLIITYSIEKKETDKKDESSKKEIGAKEYKILKEWEDKLEDKSEKKSDKEQQEKQFPSYVSINLILWDRQQKRDTKFVFDIPLIAQGEQPPEPQRSIAAELLEQSKARNPQMQQDTTTPQGTTPTSGQPAIAPVPPPMPQGLAESIDTLQTAIKTKDYAMLDTLEDIAIVAPEHIRR